MGLFGSSAVRILGELLVDGQPIACPTCQDTGKTTGHTLTPGPRGTAVVQCAADQAHTFSIPAISGQVLRAVPRRGPFTITVDGHTVTGLAARPGPGKAKQGKTGKQQAAPVRTLGKPAPAGKAPTGGGVGLGAVVVAGLNTVSSLAGAVGQTAGAAGQIAGAAATTVTAAAKLGGEGIGLARDGAKAAGQALGRTRNTPKRSL